MGAFPTAGGRVKLKYTGASQDYHWTGVSGPVASRRPTGLGTRWTMDWEVVAPMVVAVVFIVTAGGVAVLRPIAKRVSELLELYGRERSSGVTAEVGQLRELLETLDARMRLIEERQEFTEKLLGSGAAGDRPRLSGTRTPDPTSGPAPPDRTRDLAP